MRDARGRGPPGLLHCPSALSLSDSQEGARFYHPHSSGPQTVTVPSSGLRVLSPRVKSEQRCPPLWAEHPVGLLGPGLGLAGAGWRVRCALTGLETSMASDCSSGGQAAQQPPLSPGAEQVGSVQVPPPHHRQQGAPWPLVGEEPTETQLRTSAQTPKASLEGERSLLPPRGTPESGAVQSCLPPSRLLLKAGSRGLYKGHPQKPGRATQPLSWDPSPEGSILV